MSSTEALIEAALAQTGEPYVGPSEPFDCTELVASAIADFGT